MCGKISKLMVKYPLSYGQPKYEYFLLWAGLSDDIIECVWQYGFSSVAK